jgi:hypothetical protein
MVTIKYLCYSGHYFWDTYENNVLTGQYAGFYDLFHQCIKEYPDHTLIKV